MNRGKLEAWAVRVFMIRNKLRCTKRAKVHALHDVKIRVTRLSETALIDWIESFLTHMEVM